MTTNDAKKALQPLSESVQHDGYSLEIGVDEQRVEISVVAGPGACEDCLVPKDVMSMIALQALEDAGLELPGEELRLVYPDGL